MQKELTCLSLAHSVCVCYHCRVRLFATLWTIAHQAFLSTEFSRQEKWSGLPFPSSEELPNPGIEPWSPALQVDSLSFELQGSLANPREHQTMRIHTKETTWIQDPASPNHQQHPVQDASSKQQTKKQTQSSADRSTTSVSLAHQRKNKQTS